MMPAAEAISPTVSGPNGRSPVIGEVIAIGDELSTGYRLDTNTQWLSQRLTEQGVLVRFHTTVADDLQANAEVFAAAAKRADIVVATGGLGPTADDLTRDAIAAAAGVGLVEDPALVAHIEELFHSRGRDMPHQNRRQAQLPVGAAAINNPGGTAPGVDLTIGRGRLFALPGVPAEMRDMYATSVAPAVTERVGVKRITRHWLVRCFGAGESHIESLLPDLIARGREPLVGITASKGTISLRVTASGATVEACEAAIAPTLAQVRETLGTLIFAEHPGELPEVTLPQVIVGQLKSRGWRLATREAVTAGLLARWLATADPGGAVLETAEVVSPAAAKATVPNHLPTTDCSLHLGTEADGQVPIRITSPAGEVQHQAKLFGHPSIHHHVVAKQALNQLRLLLLD